MASRVVRWVRPNKHSLQYAEMAPQLQRDITLEIERRERELRKTIARLRAPTLGRRRELAKEDRPVLRKRVRVRTGFVDRLRVRAMPGRGGVGAVHFARDANRRVGPPSGGDAGRGGHVWLQADAHVRTLQGVPRQIRAGDGAPGGTNQCTGRDGRDVIVRVPVGTTVSVAVDASAGDALSLGRDFATRPLAELNAPGERVLLAQGSAGGKGNMAFTSSTNRSPQTATEGEPVAAVAALLELKLLAHVGLVGMPNAGKSSLLYSASSSCPKIAPYPFTTLHPMVGNAQFSDGTYVSICDIPGIIEGAHRNVGLGLEFLRHIERTTLLCYVLDATPPEDTGASPITQVFDVLRDELRRYDPQLLARESVVVCNKMDVRGSQAALDAMRQHTGLAVMGVSCATRKGLAELLLHLRARVRAHEQRTTQQHT